jgi:hypothetical protein
MKRALKSPEDNESTVVNKMMNGVRILVGSLGIFAIFMGACTPGYMSSKELEHREQGPAYCAKRCHELGMRMGAFVLVGDQLPGCVCQPLDTKAQASQDGASASTTAYVVAMAAAAAAQQQQQQQQRQAQQATVPR